MAWEENSCICLNMQLIAILSRIGVILIVNRSVMFNFEDAINKKLAGEDEEYEESDDFDEDYDAYDDI